MMPARTTGLINLGDISTMNGGFARQKIMGGDVFGGVGEGNDISILIKGICNIGIAEGGANHAHGIVIIQCHQNIIVYQ